MSGTKPYIPIQALTVGQPNGKVKDVRFIERIGQGNNASVWMVYGLMGEPVQLACKVLKPPEKDNPLAEERMLRIIGIGVGEYTALCRLDHPNIIKYYDVITIADRQTRYKLGAYLPRIPHTDNTDTIDTLFGTEPLIAHELMDMIQTNGPPVQAKPCDVISLGMTLAKTMMEYSVDLERDRKTLNLTYYK